MKKIIKLTEQQINNVIKRTIEEEDSNFGEYPALVHHWENKFERSIEILLKIGRNPDELIKKIQSIYEKINKND